MDAQQFSPARKLADATAGWPIAPAALVGAALLCGAVALTQPLLALAVAAAAAGGIVFVSRPDLATFAALCILYSNVAVVAVRFHGVPHLVGSAVVGLLLIPFVHALVFRREKPVLHPVLVLLLLFLGVNVMGMAFSGDADIARPMVVELVLEGIAIFFLVTNVVRTPEALRQATWALVLAGLLITIVPAWQQATKSFGDDYGGFGQTTAVGFRTGTRATDYEGRQKRLSGTIGEQNRFAQNLLMLVPLGIGLLRIERGRWRRGLALAATGAAGLGCVLAFSRGAAVAFAVLLGVMICMRLVTKRQLALLCAGAVLFLALMPQYWTRLATLANVKSIFIKEVPRRLEPDDAVKGRLTEMLAAAMVFRDHPLVGIGPGVFKYHAAAYGNTLGIRRLEGTRKAHSLFLGLAAETGALGLGLFLVILFVTMRALLRARRRLAAENPMLADLATAYFLALVAYLATGLFLHMAYIRFFYMVLGLAVAAGAIAAATPTRHQSAAGGPTR